MPSPGVEKESDYGLTEPGLPGPGRFVRKSQRSRGEMRPINASMSAPRWPMTGRTIAFSNSGLTSVGPGRKYLPNSDNILKLD